MSTARKKQSSVGSENRLLVNTNASNSSKSSSVSSATPLFTKTMYQTPKIKGNSSVIKPQYIETQDHHLSTHNSATNSIAPSPFDYQYGSYLIPQNLMTPYSATFNHRSSSSYFVEPENSFENTSDINDTFENIKDGKKRTLSSANNTMFFAPPVRPVSSMRASSTTSSMFAGSSKPFFANEVSKDDILTSSPTKGAMQIDSIYPYNGPFGQGNENNKVYVTPIEDLDDKFKLKINYSYTYTSPNPVNAIIFSNLNDNLTLSCFLTHIQMLEPFGKVAVKDAVGFKIVKDGRKDINTFLLSFYAPDALQHFYEGFVADLIKYKKMFDSKQLILRKCYLESNVLSNGKSGALNLQSGNGLQFINDDGISIDISTSEFGSDDGLSKEINLSDRFLIVESLDIDLILKILTLKKSDDPENKQIHLNIQSIYKIKNPASKKDKAPKLALMLVFDSVSIKQLAVHMFGAFAYDTEDMKINIYNVKKLHIKNQEEEYIEADGNESELKVVISASENETKSDEQKEQYIKVLNYDGHLQVSAFLEKIYNKDEINEKFVDVKFLPNTNYQQIIFKKRPQKLEEVEELKFPAQTKGDMNSTLDDDDIIETQSRYSIDDVEISPKNVSMASFHEPDSLDGLSTSSVSEMTPFSEPSEQLHANHNNRLIFISNLPPIVKIFDLVNVIRGGLIEQIRFVQGQKFCFVKFVLPSSANMFYECCQIRPIILHGFQLNVDFGKKGVSLPPALPSLMSRIAGGATRNIYLSLPEYAYKKVYTKDKKYSKYKGFKLPFPEFIIADFGSYFGPLEQINFAKDNHCCWINFMSIHSAIRLMMALQKDPNHFHETFHNKYRGLVFKYGKDRCEKLPKDVSK